jgi:hypothetical protein
MLKKDKQPFCYKTMILLMDLAYTSSIFQGTEMSEKAGAKICISPERPAPKIP